FIETFFLDDENDEAGLSEEEEDLYDNKINFNALDLLYEENKNPTEPADTTNNFT
ncbi:363_t:CDS:1, partial [Dentiscutata heterogama]